MKTFMKRDKLFFVSPELIKKWPYKSRYAIGVKLDDFKAKDELIWRFLIKNTMYEIERHKAIFYGGHYVVPGGALPNLLPVDEMKVYEI